jgi:hypothetical protein
MGWGTTSLLCNHIESAQRSQFTLGCILTIGCVLRAVLQPMCSRSRDIVAIQVTSRTDTNATHFMQHFCIQEVWCKTATRMHATGNFADTPPPPPPPKLLKPPPLKPPLLPPRKPPRKPPPRPPPRPPPLKRERCLASAPSRVTASAHSTASNSATSLNILLLEATFGLKCDYCLRTINNRFGFCLAETMPSTQSPCATLFVGSRAGYLLTHTCSG